MSVTVAQRQVYRVTWAKGAHLSVGKIHLLQPSVQAIKHHLVLAVAFNDGVEVRFVRRDMEREGTALVIGIDDPMAVFQLFVNPYLRDVFLTRPRDSITQSSALSVVGNRGSQGGPDQRPGTRLRCAKPFVGG